MDDGTETDAYHTAFEVFYIIETDKTEEQIANLGERIANHFNSKFEIAGKEMVLDSRVLIASCPDQFSTINDIFLLETVDLGKIDKKVLMGSDLDFLLRRIEVEKAIGRGLSEKKFTIYYYPIYSEDNFSIKLAQVWLRLSDTVIGDIKSEEFMEVAVNSGFIEDIQLRCIEGVCRFLSNGVDKTDMQLGFILVPVLSAELINNEVLQRIGELIEHYGIDPSLVAFVIKESYAIYAKETLLKHRNTVEKLGVRLYISDYQAGFLGLNTITDIAFEGVILDMKTIFETDDSQNADIVLANRTNMLRQLGKKIIISGVNNREYYDKIKTVEFDYVQGSFFSEEVSKNELQNKFWHGERIEVNEFATRKVYDEG
jgi:EAL domain-containing protein (putative c-di-GMP-specific phosphodiesterase class I)